MNIQEQIDLARKAWLQASEILNFKIVTPYFLNLNGKEKEVFAFLPEYGSPSGMIIGRYSQHEDKFIRNWTMKQGCYSSFINLESHLVYNEDIFKDVLEDWGKYVKITSKFNEEMIVKLKTVLCNWDKASKKLNFKIHLPLFPDKNEMILDSLYFFLPDYGSTQGSLIELNWCHKECEDKRLMKWASEYGYFYDSIYIEDYIVYNEDIFKNALKDWGKYI